MKTRVNTAVTTAAALRRPASRGSLSRVRPDCLWLGEEIMTEAAIIPMMQPRPVYRYSDERPEIATPSGASRGTRLNGYMAATAAATSSAGRDEWRDQAR